MSGCVHTIEVRGTLQTLPGITEPDPAAGRLLLQYAVLTASDMPRIQGVLRQRSGPAGSAENTPPRRCDTLFPFFYFFSLSRSRISVRSTSSAVGSGSASGSSSGSSVFLRERALLMAFTIRKITRARIMKFIMVPINVP